MVFRGLGGLYEVIQYTLSLSFVIRWVRARCHSTTSAWVPAWMRQPAALSPGIQSGRIGSPEMIASQRERRAITCVTRGLHYRS